MFQKTFHTTWATVVLGTEILFSKYEFIMYGGLVVQVCLWEQGIVQSFQDYKKIISSPSPYKRKSVIVPVSCTSKWP